MPLCFFSDAEFKKFLELLENPEAPPSLSIKDVLEEVEAKAKEKLEANNQETPLIAFINKFKLEKKRMQEVRTSAGSHGGLKILKTLKTALLCL